MDARAAPPANAPFPTVSSSNRFAYQVPPQVLAKSPETTETTRWGGEVCPENPPFRESRSGGGNTALTTGSNPGCEGGRRLAVPPPPEDCADPRGKVRGGPPRRGAGVGVWGSEVVCLGDRGGVSRVTSLRSRSQAFRGATGAGADPGAGGAGGRSGPRARVDPTHSCPH